MEQTSTQVLGLLQGSEGAVGSAMDYMYKAGLAECDISVPPLGHCRDISSDWLTKALQAGDRTIAEVVDFRMSTFAETEHETTVKLNLSYANACKDAAGPASVLCKISRHISAPQRGELIAEACSRETAAYLELKYHDVCRMPRLLFSSMDAQRYTLLLREDSGALPISHFASDTRSQIDAVLRELALLHGSFARQSPVSAPKWLLRPRDVAELAGEQYREGCRYLSACDGSTALSAEHWQVITKFADQVVAWHKFERHILTVTHGDMRSDNMLYQGRGAACRATLISWKMAGLRNPMFDVACLLSNSLTLKERRDSEMVWLERYRRQFEQSGISYTGIDAREDYRFNLFSPLIVNVCAAALPGESARQQRLLIDDIARNCQAIIDWNSLEFLGIQLGNARKPDRY